MPVGNAGNVDLFEMSSDELGSSSSRVVARSALYLTVESVFSPRTNVYLDNLSLYAEKRRSSATFELFSSIEMTFCSILCICSALPNQFAAAAVQHSSSTSRQSHRV